MLSQLQCVAARAPYCLVQVRLLCMSPCMVVVQVELTLGQGPFQAPAPDGQD